TSILASGPTLWPALVATTPSTLTRPSMMRLRACERVIPPCSATAASSRTFTRLHRLLDPDLNEPPVHRIRREKADTHTDLHHEPVRRLIRLQARLKDHEMHQRHPPEESHFECGERERVRLDRGPKARHTPYASHWGDVEVLKRYAEYVRQRV